MTPAPEIVCTCRLTLDGMIVLAEQTFTLLSGHAQQPNTYFWSFPFGAGSLHTIGVHVTFAERCA
jgi:hypothetical protein